MHTMKDILELAGRIRDRELRRKTIEILRSPGSLSNRKMRYAQVPFDKAPASTDWHHAKTGGLLEHTYAVARMCISVAEEISRIYGNEIDMDSLIAGALLHDIGKVWGVKKTKRGWEGSGLTIDHTMLGTSELHKRHFPEKVIHIVASHFGESGPTPPQTAEALIVHTIDNMDALMHGDSQEQRVINLILG